MESRIKNQELRMKRGVFKKTFWGIHRDSLFYIPDSTQKGFALLFAIIASSVLLSIGLGIWNIAFKELVLSSFGRESQVAFYVADSAIECALYHDFIGTNVFATSSNSIPGGVCNGQEYNTFQCASLTVSNYVKSCDGQNATTTFTINLGNGKAIVLIGKSDPGGTGRSATNIVSHGQNSTTNYNPTLVERGLRSSY